VIIRKDDQVQIMTGEDKGKTARVLLVFKEQNKIVVEGVNRAYKHLKPNRDNPQGGRLSKELAMSASNVLLYCATCRRGVRVGKRYGADGRKERYCKKCNNSLGQLSKARAKYAKK
jgi:large subunit ribosomal protein L24